MEPAPVPATAPATAHGPATPDRGPGASVVAAPSRLRIPAIGVDSPVVGIGVDGSGALVPPDGTEVTGWYTAGPAPGAAGPALLAGHVDSRSGPAVLYRLREVPVGARVEVDRADGSTAAFVVTAIVQTPKAAFPTDDVYAPTPGPELRLVTCGGTFDPAIGHYRDNVVVDAVAEGGTWTIDR
ncbi:class F sortase [Pseudonocardia sp.]|uniref:class F sortase n=1 Tax=Pseudonocardia sp. TaxID=60912 RepID=UPI002613038E|nr:class F sortase [Pseudonocardia sp.]